MSVADFLFTPGQQRMLAPLLLHPDQTYMLTELLHFAGTGRGAGQQQINKLLKSGVLIEQRMGNQRRIRANAHFPLYPELRSICLKSFGLVEHIRAALLPLASVIQEAFIFGSVARGEDRPESDIDLMVVGSLDLTTLLDTLAPVEKGLARPIHTHLYSPPEWESLKVQDAVVAKIATGPILRILPDVATA